MRKRRREYRVINLRLLPDIVSRIDGWIDRHVEEFDGSRMQLLRGFIEDGIKKLERAEQR